MTPAVLLGQAGWMPFSNYEIKPDETGVTGTIVSLCSIGRTFVVVHFPATIGFRSLFLARLLVWNLGASPHLEFQDYRNEV